MFSIYHFSVFADLTLGSILVFLWLIRRSDRHALCWGLGHALIGLMVYLWNSSSSSNAIEPLSALGSILATTCLIAGAQYYRGQKAYWLPNLVLWSALLLPAIPLGNLAPVFFFPYAVSLCLATAFFWCAWTIFTRQSIPYRILALLLALRALHLVANVISGITQTSFEFFAIALALKIAATLGLIYAVMHENEVSFLRILNGLGHGFLIRDAQGTIRFASQKLLEHMGMHSGEKLQGKHVSSITQIRHENELSDWYRHVTTPGVQLPCIDERTYTRKDGSQFPAEVLSVPFPERGQTLIITQVIDISERKALEAQRQHAANHDESTGLFNRAKLKHALGEHLAANLKNGLCTILLLIDLDHFKRINETLGHSIGDKLLKQIAERLQALQHSNDFIARFGGDEFAIMIPDQSSEDLQEHAERLAKIILLTLSQPFQLGNYRISLKASIGIALGPMHAHDPENLLSAADAALYSAKDAGRNRWQVFDESMVASSRNALMIDEALQHAIANNEFKLVYQPIVDARTRRLHKVEALLRWTTPTLGFVSPNRFIPIAEESGQIVEIGTWVLKEAARQACEWSRLCEAPIRIAVNVSAAQLVDPEFLRIVDESIHESGATPSEIEIEMTERVLINEADAVVRVIDALHAKGISTSLDDFGTGYSSLSYLTRFHLRTLKIDRSFVNGVESDPRKLALARAIIAMGQSLGMQIVAEGVETEEQASLLTELGCEYLQGYLFSRPVPASELPGLNFKVAA